jgi:uncharacterized protein YkwD
MTRAEVDLLHAVNATRAANGVAPLRVDPALERAARAKSTQILRTGVFSHGNFAARMAQFHVRGPAMGENLAWGSGTYGTTASFIDLWMHSAPHRANLLRPGYRRIGIGTAAGTFDGTSGAVIATADFAGR